LKPESLFNSHTSHDNPIAVNIIIIMHCEIQW